MARSPKAVGLPCTLWHTQWWRCRRARRSRNRAEWKTASVPSSWALVEELEGFCIKKMSQNINLFSFDREITNGQACIIHWHTCNYRISDVQGKMDWNTTGVLFKHLSKHNIFVGLFVMLPKCIMQGIFSLFLSHCGKLLQRNLLVRKIITKYICNNTRSGLQHKVKHPFIRIMTYCNIRKNTTFLLHTWFQNWMPCES